MAGPLKAIDDAKESDEETLDAVDTADLDKKADLRGDKSATPSKKANEMLGHVK